MEIKAPSFENKWNINTIWITICVLGSIVTAIVYGASQANSIKELAEWKAAHLAEHSLRRSERERADAENRAKDVLQDQQIAEGVARIERMGDRITSSEEGIKNANARSDRLADAVGDLRGAIQESNQKLAIVQTILERIETKQQARLDRTPPELTTSATGRP